MAGFARVQSDEALEDALAFVFRYAGPVVGDDGLGIAVAPSEFHVDSAGGVMAASAFSMRLRRTRSSASGSPRTVASSSALSVIAARGARRRASSTSGRTIVARSTGARVGRASRRASPRRSSTRRPSRPLSRATAASRRSRLGPFGLFAQQGLDTRLKRSDRGAELVRRVGEEPAGGSVARARLLDGCLESVEHLIEGGGETAELGIGAAGIEPELRVAVADADRRRRSPRRGGVGRSGCFGGRGGWRTQGRRLQRGARSGGGR